MRTKFSIALALLALSAGSAAAQEPPQAPANPDEPAIIGQTVCDLPIRAPRADPPAGSTFFFSFELCWPTQGNTSAVEYETYLFYTQLEERLSLPSQGKWTPWDESLE